MKTKRIYMLMLLAGAVAMSCKPGYQEQLAAVNTAQVTQVAVSTLELSHEPIPVTASGVLASKSQVLLSFKVGGVIDQIFVDEGQSFKKGQVLARLELTEIDARVNQAEESVKKLTRDQGRVKRLYADTVATLEQVQDITTALEVAQSDLEIARYNRQYAAVIAKESGRVLRRLPEKGELINPGVPVFQVAYTSKSTSHIVKIGVADRDVVKVQLGDSAAVQFDAYPGESFKARVSEIAEAADPRTGTFELELTLDPTAYRLRNGFVAKLQVYPSLQNDYYKVPMSALVEGDGEAAIVYVPEAASVKKVSLHPTYITDSYFVVEGKDLEKVSQVVTKGAAYAKPGEAVEILND